MEARDVIGKIDPPQEITQEAWDRDDGHLRRLARLRPDDRAEPTDLWAYTQDLLYTEIQKPFFLYALPFCLQAWHDDLLGLRGYAGFVEHFYVVLARGVLDGILTPKQSSSVSEFMRQTILQEVDDQRGLAFRGSSARPYRWAGALATYGVIRPDIERLWNAWWALGTVGRAVAAVQYIASLMYVETENPIFGPWTRTEGGGPLPLWGFEGHLYEHRWLQHNVDFLKHALDPQRVRDTLIRAVTSLEGQAEHEVAVHVQADLPRCTAVLESRCAELPRLLATTQGPNAPLLEWSL